MKDNPSLKEAESSKFSKILEIISQISTYDPEKKIIIFSSFTAYLDLISSSLSSLSLPHARIDGKQSSKERGENVKEFTSSSATSIILISLKAGGTGLNLVEASYVIMCDPWWNTATGEYYFIVFYSSFFLFLQCHSRGAGN